MGQEVLCERRRLTALQVGVARENGPGVLARPLDERRRKVGRPGDRALRRAPLPQSERDRGLVVPAAGRVKTPSGVTDLLAQLALDPGMDVLVHAADFERPCLDPPQNGTEAFEDGHRRFAVDDLGLEQHPRMSETTDEVGPGQATIERQGASEAVDDRIDRRVEGGAPKPGGCPIARLRAQQFAPSRACPRMPTARSISASPTTSGGSMRIVCGLGALTISPAARQRFATSGAAGLHSIAVINP